MVIPIPSFAPGGPESHGGMRRKTDRHVFDLK
jgi:hypothetical protein